MTEESCYFPMQISTRNSDKLGLMAQHTLEIVLQELTCGGLYSTAIDRHNQGQWLNIQTKNDLAKQRISIPAS